MNNPSPSELPDFLATKVATAISWLAAFLGLGTAIGWVNLLVGLLSACWLAVQLWNYCRFTLPANLAAEHKRKAKLNVDNSISKCPQSDQSSN